AWIPTNRGVLQATNGSTLSVGMPVGYALDNSSGQIVASGSGSLVQLAGPPSISDPPLVVSGGSFTRTQGASLYTGGVLFNGVHKSGELSITEWCKVGDGGLTNDGRTKLEGFPAQLRMTGHATVDGNGALEMSDFGWFDATIDGDSPSSTLTLAADQ